MIQLDLFRESELEMFLEDLKKVKEETANVRKGLFARYNCIEREVAELSECVKRLTTNMQQEKDYGMERKD